MQTEGIRWSHGPRRLRVGERLDLPLPKDVVYAEGVEMRRFLVATGNTLTGHEVAVFGAGDLSWFVIVSDAPRASGKDLEWAEESREADGRDVVILSILRGNTLFEVVSEKSGADTAGRSTERILSGLREREEPRSWWWLLLLAPLLILLLIRWRRSSKVRVPLLGCFVSRI